MVENSSKPLPIAVVHGKKKGGLTALGPLCGNVPKRGQIQLMPTTRQKSETFPNGVLKQARRECRGGGTNAMSQSDNFFGSWDREQTSQGGGGRGEETLPKSRSKGEFDYPRLEGFEDWRCSAHG